MALPIPANRQFLFFTQPRLQGIVDEQDNPLPFEGIRCMQGFQNLLFCGCDDGRLMIIRKRFSQLIATTVHAHEKPLLFIAIAPLQNVLVSFSEEPQTSYIQAQMWKIPTFETPSPRPYNVIRFELNPAPRLTAVAVSSDASQVAVGFDNGDTIVTCVERMEKAPQKQNKHISPEDGLSKKECPVGWQSGPITAESVPCPAVTSLYFAEETGTSTGPARYYAIFITNIDSIRALQTTPFDAPDLRVEVLQKTGGTTPNTGCGDKDGHFTSSTSLGLVTFHFSGRDRNFFPAGFIGIQGVINRFTTLGVYNVLVAEETIGDPQQEKKDSDKPARLSPQTTNSSSKLLIFEPNLKYIAFQCPVFPHPHAASQTSTTVHKQQNPETKIFGTVVSITAASSCIFLLTHSPNKENPESPIPRLYILCEKDFQTKRKVLEERNLFDFLISIAEQPQHTFFPTTQMKLNSISSFLFYPQTESITRPLIATFKRQNGDYLLNQKSDPPSALVQYKDTIGFVEPGFIISQLIQTHNVDILAEYLLALHSYSGPTNQLNRQQWNALIAKGEKKETSKDGYPICPKGTLATPEHTTLLLNCFTQLDKQDELSSFLQKRNDSGTSFTFDVDTAIRVCFQAGFSDQALELADSAGRVDWALRVILEEKKNTHDMGSFDKKDGAAKLNEQNDDDKSLSKKNRYQKALDRIRMMTSLADRENALLKYGKLLLDKETFETTRMLVELCTGVTVEPDFTIKESQQDTSSLRLSKVDSLIHLFVDQPAMLIEFLTIAQHTNPDQSLFVYHEMIEQYLKNDDLKESQLIRHPRYSHLSQFNSKLTPDEREEALRQIQEERKHKVSTILSQYPSRYENRSALEICKHYNFKEGVLFLYEKAHSYKEILQFYMDDDITDEKNADVRKRKEEEKYSEIFKTCKEFGKPKDATVYDPHLWEYALTYLASLRATLNQCTESIRDKYITLLLDEIRTVKELPILPSLQTLAQNEEIKLGTVKNYVKNCIRDFDEDIQRTEQHCDELRRSVGNRNRHTRMLRHTTQIFQSGVCAHCHSRLDLPVVHFMCGHSFHSTCLMDEKQCNICAAHIRDVQQRMDTIRRRALGENDPQAKQLGFSGTSKAEDFGAFMSEADESGFPVIVEYFAKGLLNKQLYLAQEEEAMHRQHHPH
ncbi:putative Vacuolar protein-sorting-associated protein 11 like protein [Blattamonas nauphoetae]|uniref:Vacuolar protein-sorting-associated protein 11 like protein n=1 Tax=Blattamonas nauphoetae TaxID=2049346 RepID=A0ABQ9YL09_9EUKA|nr:putative Vacuolar protein-sorting-associated protein 11 like protein [Blattamonas nauphoetae]